MGVVVVLLLPFGAMFIRMGGNGIVHGTLQALSLVALLVGLGLGIRLADMRHMVSSLTTRRYSPFRFLASEMADLTDVEEFI